MILTPPSGEDSRVPSDTLEEVAVASVAISAAANDERIAESERTGLFDRALEEPPPSDNADDWDFKIPSKKDKKQKR